MTESAIETLPVLGLSYAEFVRIERLPMEEAESELAALKERARKGYKKAAVEFHPDRHANEPREVQEAKTQQFMAATELVKYIQRLELGVREDFYDIEEEMDAYAGYDSRRYAEDPSEGDFIVVEVMMDPRTGRIFIAVSYVSR